MRRFTTFLVVVLTANALAACTSSSDDAVLNAEPAAPTTTTTAPSSTTTTEAETTTTTVSDADLTDEEQVVELHRQFLVDQQRVNEVEGTPDPAEREAWMREHVAEPQLTRSLQAFASWENDGETIIDDGGLSNIDVVEVDGDTAIVLDCFATVARNVGDEADPTTGRSEFLLVQSKFERDDGMWLLTSLASDGTECDPGAATNYAPPALEPDEIADAYERFMDFFPRDESEVGYGQVLEEADRLTVDPFRAWLQETTIEREAQGMARTGASIRHRLIASSQRGEKAVALACVGYVPAIGEELEDGFVGDGQTEREPSHWKIFFRRADGEWLVEAISSGGLVPCSP